MGQLHAAAAHVRCTAATCTSIDDFEGFCDDGYVSWEIVVRSVHAVLSAPTQA